MLRSWSNPFSSVNRLDERCERNQDLRNWNSGSSLAELGKTGKEWAGERGWKSAHSELKMPHKHQSGSGPEGTLMWVWCSGMRSIGWTFLDHLKRHFFDLAFFWFPKVAQEEHQQVQSVMT